MRSSWSTIPRSRGTPVLLVNPGVRAVDGRRVRGAGTASIAARLGDWREGRNDLEAPALALVPEIGDVLDWLRGQAGADFVRMSGSGATCFALFDDEAARDAAAAACPSNWWHLASNSALGRGDEPPDPHRRSRCAPPKRGRSTPGRRKPR